LAAAATLAVAAAAAAAAAAWPMIGRAMGQRMATTTSSTDRATATPSMGQATIPFRTPTARLWGTVTVQFSYFLVVILAVQLRFASTAIRYSTYAAPST